MRVEHLSQPSDQPKPTSVNLELNGLINQFRAVSAHEFYAGGDVAIDSFSRMEWKTSETTTQLGKVVNQACSLDNLCIEVSPGDLRTIVITGHFLG